MSDQNNPAIHPAALMELLASRICHDIISPVGAINNGVEFIEDTSDPASIKDAIDLIQHSAQQAASKLMAFRLAYGAGGRDGNIKPEDIQKAFGNLVRGDGKVRQSWDPFSPLGIDTKTKGFCKILMGTMMLAIECLPKGGTVLIDPGTEKNTMLVKAEGTDAVVRDGVENALAHTISPDDLDPRLVHPYAISLIAESYGFNIRIQDKAEGKVVILVTGPTLDPLS